jgi:hypothetical protein
MEEEVGEWVEEMEEDGEDLEVSMEEDPDLQE